MRALTALVALLPAMAAAETAYVTDNLRLGLHQAEDTSDRAFRTLESGQELEILSRNRNYAQVQLPEGVTGYVKAAYLVFEKPAKLIVAETQAERDQLQLDIEQLRQQFAGPAETIAALEQDGRALREQLDQSVARVAELDDENASLRKRQASQKFSLPIAWVAGATAVCLIGGFLLGLWWVDVRSRRRHGGIRIY